MLTALIKQRPIIAVGALMVTLALALACGSTEAVIQTVVVEKAVPQTVVVEKQVPGEKVVQTVVVEKQVPGEKVVQTVVVEKEKIVEKAVVQTVVVANTVVVVKEISAPGRIVPKGQLRIASGEVSFPALIPSRAGLLPANVERFASIYEPSLYMNENGFILPQLAEAWEITADGKKYTFQLKKGVPFHGNWGEMTANDWVWTANDAWWNPESNRTSNATAKSVNARPKAIDKYIVEVNLDKPDPLTFFPYLLGFPLVASEKRFKDLGPEKAMSGLPDGGTGPFQIKKWTPETELIVEAVKDHHFKTSSFAELKFVQMTEQSTILAALKAGEIDVGPIAITFKDEVVKSGLQTKASGEGMFWMQITGNFCVKEFEGKALPARPGYNTSLPWIGDCNNPDSMEKARKVRSAMSMAIDREKIVKGVVGGAGRPLQFVDAQGKNYDVFLRRTGKTVKDFEIPFDLAKAKQYLAEAGWPNGFSFENVCVTGRHPLGVELCEAVANQWEASGLGLKPQSVRQIYTGGLRDRLVRREFAGVWSQGQGGQGVGLFYPLGDAARRPDAAFNPGTEQLVPLEFHARAQAAKTTEEVDKILLEYMSWQLKWHYSFGVIGFEDIFVINPKVVGNWPRSARLAQHTGDFEFMEHAK